MKAIVLVIFSLSLISCVAPVPMEQITYKDDDELWKNHKFESLTFTTGRVDGSPYAPVYVKTPNLFFGETDQAEFIRILERELDARGVTFGKGGEGKIIVDFIDSFYESNSSYYKLQVRLVVALGNSQVSMYQINSNDGFTTWQNLNTTPNQHRNMAAELLLNQVMADISNYLSGV